MNPAGSVSVGEWMERKRDEKISPAMIPQKVPGSNRWKEHLRDIHHLKSGISFVAYIRKVPPAGPEPG